MTTPNDPQPMTFAEIRAMLENTAIAAAENTRAIAELRVRERESAALHDREMADIRAREQEHAAHHEQEMAAIRRREEESAARHDRAMAEMRRHDDERAAWHHKQMAEMSESQAERIAWHEREMAVISLRERESTARFDREIAVINANIEKLTQAQDRTNQDVSTLKGWGLELYCKRNPEIFAASLGLRDEEVVSNRDIRNIAAAARQAGVITLDQSRELSRADIYIHARRDSNYQPLCLVVEASYQVDGEDVSRAADRAALLDQVIREYQPRNLNGQAIPIVAGTDIAPIVKSAAASLGVTYVNVQNGNQLTNPSE